MRVTVAYVDSDGVERSCVIGTEPVLIGREAGCTIHSNDGLVSRRHAKLWVDATGMLRIEDLGSSNGVFVGPSRVKVSPFPIGAVVVVGSLRFRRLAHTPGKSEPPAPVHEILARKPTLAVMVRPATPTAAPIPGADAHTMLLHLLETEREMRRAVEHERDVYGARVNQLHLELEAARARIAELEWLLRTRG